MPAELEDILVEWTDLPETVEKAAGSSESVTQAAGASPTEDA